MLSGSAQGAAFPRRDAETQRETPRGEDMGGVSREGDFDAEGAEASSCAGAAGAFGGGAELDVSASSAPKAEAKTPGRLFPSNTQRFLCGSASPRGKARLTWT